MDLDEFQTCVTEADSEEEIEACKEEFDSDKKPCGFPKFEGFKNKRAECIHNLGEISQEQQYVEMKAFANASEADERVAMEHLERIDELINETKEIGCISEETYKSMKNCHKSMEENYKEFFDTHKNDDRNAGNLAGDSLNMWAVTRGANEVSEFED